MSNNPRDSMDRLMDETRITGATRMIAEGTPATAVTEDTAKQVIINVREYQDRSGRTYKAIARDIGVNPTTLSSVLGMSYGGDWQTIILDLDRWLEAQAKRESAPKTSSFVKTNVFREIETIANMAVSGNMIGLIVGDSGIGKSLAFAAIAEAMPGSVMVTLDSAHNTPVGMLTLIAKAMQLRTDYYKTETPLFERIRDVLMGTSRLLIIDEIHSVLERNPPRALTTLRYLHDATGAPQLWGSTVDMIGQLRKSAQNGRQPLEQIIRRISIRHDLMDRADGADGGGDGETLFSLEEIRAMYGKNKMRLSPDAARFLMLLANVPKNGHLGACSAVVKLAVRANSGETVLTMDMLKHMMRYTEFRGAYRLIAAKMEQGTGSLKLKIV